jgi:MFS family permease
MPLQIASIVFVVGAILMVATSHSLGMMYAGRVITGLGVGTLTAVIPTYISEIAPPALRGTLTGTWHTYRSRH